MTVSTQKKSHATEAAAAESADATRKLVGLTWAIVGLTAVLVVLTIVLAVEA